MRSAFKAAVISVLSIFFLSGVMVSSSYAASKEVLNIQVKDAVKRFYREVSQGKELADKSRGMLVFPSILKAGLVVGGEYGEGALLVDRKIIAYYSSAAASIGFQAGAQSKTVVLLFMTGKALKNFRTSEGWKVGVDGSVALVKQGTGGSIDSDTLQQPIIGFIFGNKGLMFNLTFEGSKITRIKK